MVGSTSPRNIDFFSIFEGHNVSFCTEKRLLELACFQKNTHWPFGKFTSLYFLTFLSCMCCCRLIVLSYETTTVKFSDFYILVCCLLYFCLLFSCFVVFSALWIFCQRYMLNVILLLLLLLLVVVVVVVVVVVSSFIFHLFWLFETFLWSNGLKFTLHWYSTVQVNTVNLILSWRTCPGRALLMQSWWATHRLKKTQIGHEQHFALGIVEVACPVRNTPAYVKVTTHLIVSQVHVSTNLWEST